MSLGTLDKPCGSWGQLPPQSQQNCVVPRQDLAAHKWLLTCSCVQGTTAGSLCTELGVLLANCPCTRQKITIPITYSSFYVSNLCFPAQTGCPCGKRAIGGPKNPLGASGCIACSHNLSFWCSYFPLLNCIPCLLMCEQRFSLWNHFSRTYLLELLKRWFNLCTML